MYIFLSLALLNHKKYLNKCTMYIIVTQVCADIPQPPTSCHNVYRSATPLPPETLSLPHC